MAALPWTSGIWKAHYFCMLCATTAPGYAQQPASVGGEIIVTGQRGVMGVQADRVIGEDEISSYGLSSVDELLDEIANERGNRRDEIVYLIDGKRISGLGDISAYPTEAVDRIEILPRGAAAPIGGSPSQQVVNISLKPNLRNVVGRGSSAIATDGGFTAQNGEISLTNITRPRRVNLALRWRQENALLESERDVVQASNAPDEFGRFRSLRPEIANVEVRGSVADQLAPNLTGFVTARLFDGSTRAFLGRGNNGNRLDQQSKLTSGNIEMQLNGELGSWLLAFNGAFGEIRQRTRTDVSTPAGAQPGDAILTRARVRNASTGVNATKAILNLPAGPISLTLRGSVSQNSIDASLNSFTQWNREVSASVQIPISNAAGRFSALGDLTAGIEQSYSRASRVGALTNATYSIQWQPLTWLRLSGSVATGRTPPGVELTSAPALATPGVRYLDPLRGDTTDVVVLTGGNSDLSAQRGNSQRVSLEIRPPNSAPLAFTAEYFDVHNEDIITALPSGNNLLLLAFPERFLRDSAGRLTSVDIRPLNFARQREEQIRYSLELNVPLNPDVARISNTENLTTNRSWPTARLRFNLSHAILLKSEVLVSQGFEPVDLLSRDAFGFNGGERPRHLIDFGAEYAARGIGVQLSGQHRGPSFINLTGGTAPDILRFSPITTFSMRAFTEGQRLLPSAAWLKGTRLSLQVANIINARQKVLDQRGITPLFYQSVFRDPTGRMVQVEVRKVF